MKQTALGNTVLYSEEDTGKVIHLLDPRGFTILVGDDESIDPDMVLPWDVRITGDENLTVVREGNPGVQLGSVYLKSTENAFYKLLHMDTAELLREMAHLGDTHMASSSEVRGLTMKYFAKARQLSAAYLACIKENIDK